MIFLLSCASAVESGERAWAAGDWAGVVDAWQSEELDVERRQRLARALLRLDRVDAARALIDAVPEEERTATGWLVAGTLAAESGELDRAIIAFETGLAREPMPELAVNLCTASLLQDPHQSAARCAQAAQLAPTDPRALVGLAEAVRATDPELARRSALGALALIDEDPELRPWLSELLAAVGEWGAICTLQVAEPLALGQACLAAGRPREAAAALEPLQSPEAAALLLRLAVDEAERTPSGGARELALARAHRWTARLSEERWVGLLVDLGRLSALDGDWAAAEAHWSQAIALAPNEPAPRLNLARALARRGADAEAEAVLREGAGVASPEAVALSLALAEILARTDRTSEAEDRFNAAIDACRGWGMGGCVAEASLRLGLSRLARGDEAGAIAPLKEAATVGGEAMRARLGSEALPESVRRELPLLSGR